MTMKQNRQLWRVLAAGALVGLVYSPLSRADDTTRAGATAGSSQQAEQSHEGFLGVGVEGIDSWMMEHLKELIGKDEGVRVVEVASDSPAEKAGVKVNDIIVSYDDQRVYTPEQLLRLVEDDQPGRKVTLGVIQSGKSETLTATLAPRSENALQTEQVFRIPLGPLTGTATDEQADESWDTFDSMSLTRLDEHRFRAEIKFRNEEGKIETQQFEGTREEIRSDIQAQKDLPESERNHLLFALRMEGRPIEVHVPVVRIRPDGELELYEVGVSDHPALIQAF